MARQGKVINMQIVGSNTWPLIGACNMARIRLRRWLNYWQFVKFDNLSDDAAECRVERWEEHFSAPSRWVVIFDSPGKRELEPRKHSVFKLVK